MSNPLMQMMGGNNPMNAMMQNNPIMQLVGALKNGGNPQALFQQMASKNPQLQQIMQMTQGKNQQEMSQYIQQAAQQRGVDLTQLAKNIGLPPDVAKNLNIKID